MNPKLPQTHYPVLDVIKNRYSARSFATKPIEPDTLHELIEAASWAPSSMNEQPWKYFYAHKGTPAFEQLWSLLLTGNQPWCKDAALLLVSVASKTFVRNGAPNRHYLYDTGAANQNLLLQALSRGIYGHLLGGYQHDKATEYLKLQENEEIACFIALGYLDVPEKLEEPFLTREKTPRSRKPISDILFSI